jgi:hypothetical protein
MNTPQMEKKGAKKISGWGVEWTKFPPKKISLEPI